MKPNSVLDLDPTLQPIARERLWSNIEKTSGCWNWKGGTYRGYARFQVNGIQYRSHRAAYELTKGRIPDTLTIDHLCRNRRCVNPEHLEAVPNGVNVLRGFGLSANFARADFCVNGHPLSSSNISPSALRRGTRKCLTCHREQERTRRARSVTA